MPLLLPLLTSLATAVPSLFAYDGTHATLHRVAGLTEGQPMQGFPLPLRGGGEEGGGGMRQESRISAEGAGTSQAVLSRVRVKTNAQTPPMGWNSWDCFGTGVTEALTLENADYMATHLKKHGWQYVTVDIQWFVPDAKGWNYKPGAEVLMDAYARPLPAPNRFPSANNSKGFKPLADAIHHKGLKFGVHLLRGIPRQAVTKNLPILGTSLHAADIADRSSTCPWNSDMYGVDMSKSGAQAYYDSLLAQLAAWGVDLVKVDDLSTPYHQPEIEAIRKAIDKSGRPIVFSTSPGPTGVEHGPNVQANANMWRISDDFWDSWGAVKEQFERLDRWTPFRGPGHWPDADMLPLGAVRQGQRDDWTHLTQDEQYTLMTLWSICKSPLILGGHLPKNDAFTLSLLTNDEVLAVDQNSLNNRQLWRRDNAVAWVADVPHSRDKYLAVFNIADQYSIDPAKAAFRSGVVTRSTPGQAVDIDIDVTGKRKLYLYADALDDGIFADHVVWAEPMLTGTFGERKLTSLKWDSATQGYGQAAIDKSVIGKPLVLDGKPVPFGIGTHATSMIEFTLPEGAHRFHVRAGLEHEGVILDHGATVRFSVFTQDPMSGSSAATAPIRIDLSDLGLPPSANLTRETARPGFPLPLRGGGQGGGDRARQSPYLSQNNRSTDFRESRSNLNSPPPRWASLSGANRRGGTNPNRQSPYLSSAETVELGFPLPLRGGGVREGVYIKVKIRDLWTHKTIEASQIFAPEIPWHGARLFRISPE